MKTERKIPIFPTLRAAEAWVDRLPCHSPLRHSVSGACEGDLRGESYVRLSCWRHDHAEEIAYRLVAFQDRYTVDPYDG